MRRTTRSYFTVRFCLPACLCALSCQTVVFAAENIDYSNRRSYPISVEPFFTAGIALGDIDGDGDLDMVEANGVILNKGNGVFDLSQQFGADTGRSYAILAHDKDKDDDIDIIVANVGGKNRVFLNDGAGQLSLLAEIGLAEHKTYALGVGDINGDGLPDIIAGNSEGANIVYFQTVRSD